MRLGVVQRGSGAIFGRAGNATLVLYLFRGCAVIVRAMSSRRLRAFRRVCVWQRLMAYPVCSGVRDLAKVLWLRTGWS